MRSRQFAQSTLGLALILATPAMVHAYSLGEIRVTSQLGEAFYAEVPLHLRKGEVVKDFAVSLAKLEDYLVLELHRSPVVGQLDAKIRSDGRGPRIVLKSESLVQEPFFNLLIKTTTGSGSHFRNFPIFLDMKMPSMARPGPRPTPPKPAVVQDLPRPTKKAPKAIPATPLATSKAYGPVQRGDNLLSIARQLQGQYAGVSNSQLAAAIWRQNPGAFARGNINALLAGKTLNLPEHTEVAKLTTQETRQILSQQYREWQGDGVARSQPAPKSAPAERPEKAPETPTKPEPVEKPATTSTLPPGEVRQPNGKVAQTTERPTGEPPKPQASEKTEASADKQVVFDQRVTMHAGEEPSDSTAAKPTTEDTTAPKETPADAAAADALSLQLSKNLSRLNTLEGKLGETTAALQSSEQARSKLQSNLATLQQRMEKLEKERIAESELNLQDILLYLGLGLGVLIIGGVLALLTRRRKPAAIAPTHAAPVVEETPPANGAAAMVAAAAVGGVAVATMADEEEEEEETESFQTPTYALNELTPAEDEEQITPFSPNEFEEEEEETEVSLAMPSRGTDQEKAVSLKKPDQFGEKEPAWQTSLGMEEDNGLTSSAADLDLDGEQSDLDLDAFASSTVIGMGDDDAFGVGDEGALNLDDSLADSFKDQENMDTEGTINLGALHARPFAATDSNQGVEELDFSSLDSFSGNGGSNGLELPSLGEEGREVEDEGGLFLPGASFDEDEEGTMEAIPIARGPGASPQHPPTMMEMDGLEAIDVESLGLEEENSPADMDLDDSPDFSLGNMDDDMGEMDKDLGLQPIEVPPFDVVEMDFEEKNKPVKEEKKPPAAGHFELTTIDFDMDDEKHK